MDILNTNTTNTQDMRKGERYHHNYHHRRHPSENHEIGGGLVVVVLVVGVGRGEGVIMRCWSTLFLRLLFLLRHHIFHPQFPW